VAHDFLSAVQVKAVNPGMVPVARQITVVIVSAGVAIAIVMLVQIACRELAVHHVPPRIRLPRGVLLRRMIHPTMSTQRAIGVGLADLVERGTSRDSDHNPHSDTKRSDGYTKGVASGVSPDTPQSRCKQRGPLRAVPILGDSHSCLSVQCKGA
jgi:hypothetical protein